MQYLIRKPIVHTNPIVEKEETNKKTRIVTFQNSPSLACTTKESNQFSRQFQHHTWLDSSRILCES